MDQFKETYEFIKFLVEFTKAGFLAAADGKVTLSDYPAMIPAIMAAPNAFTGLNLVSEEYRTATEEERLQFHEIVAQEFDIPDDRVEVLIEDVLKYGGGLFVAVSKFVKSKELA